MTPLVISRVLSAADTATLDIDVETVLNAIRTGGKKKLRGQITQIRNRFEAELAIAQSNAEAGQNVNPLQVAKLAVGELKKQLPAVMWCGQFSNRKEPVPEKLQKHSGLFIGDLDDLGERLPDTRKKLEANPHVFALFLSPSGNGLKVVFRVPADGSKHAGSYRAVEKHVRELTGVQIDESGKDIGRLCFMSYDPDIYVNENAIELGPLPEPEKLKTATFNTNVDLTGRERITAELLQCALEWCPEKNGYFVTCPAISLHTTGHNAKECIVYLNGPPTIECKHTSCRGVVEGVNHELRSRIGKAEFVQTPRVDLRGGASAQQGEADEGEDATITRLAALSPLEYERIRKAEAETLGWRVTILDELVANRRPPSVSATGKLQGRTLNLPDVEPCPEPVNGAEVLHEAAETYSRYVALPAGAADALALWTVHTHCFQAFQCSPRLNVTSPEKQCGKSTLRDVIATLVPRPLPTENLRVAVLFRVIEKHRPTMLADECDAWINDNEELRGLLNAGHKRGGQALRCEGENNEPQAFNVFGAVVICGIGALPGTLHDRSIVIRLERAKPGELRQRFDSRHVEREAELCRKLARFTADNIVALEASDPKMPNGVFNRLADNWRPLFAIAEIAGGDWPERCAAAFIKLTSREDDRESLRVMLLADIQQVFTSDRIFSKDLVELLAQLSERPWPEICRGRPINERWLARNLADFGIHSKTLRIGEERAKGYELSDFGEAFDRYLPVQGDFIRDSVTYEGKPVFSSVTKLEHVTDTKNDSLIGKKGICHGVTLEKGGSPEKEGPEEPAPATVAVEDTEGEL